MYTEECTCLESVINRFFNGGKKQKLFLTTVKRNAEGDVVECFTKRGGAVYDKFVDGVYALGNHFGSVGELEDFLESLKNIGISREMSFGEVVDETDAIASGTGY